MRTLELDYFADSLALAACSNTLVAIDASLPAADQLAAGLQPGAALLWLRAGDRLTQIADHLEQHPGYRRLHLVSHGAPGQIHLGEQVINAATLRAQATTLRRWRAAMMDGFDLLLYGCQVAQGKSGRDFLQTWHDLTGARLAASTTLIGQAALGGNWDLDAAIATRLHSSPSPQRCNAPIPASSSAR
ncbi:MAG: DUF4347 domain-containing protein [Spirulinaceae cyanobacterium SM2_1_0]|nr:DUF4347 domain-containing protein [Spirulinaceae cyanobacterium SM2_1_0]